MHVPKRALKILFVSTVAVLAAALTVAACGGSSSGGGGEPAGLMPKSAPVYLGLNLAPEAKTSEALDELTGTILGIENVGEFVAEKLEKAALGQGQKFNFEKEVEPWLGEKAGMYLTGYEGEEFSGYGIAIETTNSGEAEEFIEKRVEASGNGAKAGEFEGHKYYAEPADESVLGMIGDYLSFAQTKADFEQMVKASEGEGLDASPKFKAAMEAAPGAGVGNVYVDIGGLIEAAKGALPAESEAFFDLVGVEPRQATAVATVVPHSEQLEVDLSTNLGKATAKAGDASQLLESLPASAVAGFASADFGKSFGEGVGTLDESGIPGQIQPGELKPALEALGINLDSIAASIGGIAGFVEGADVAGLGGAVVIETKDATEARKTVGDVGLLLRAAGTKGVTAISGKLSGFSVHAAGLGPKPLIFGAAGERIVVAYGPKAAAQALRTGTATLGSTADFRAGKSALGSTPISAFVAGAPALRLAEAALPASRRAGFAEAKPFLAKIAYLAIGSEAEGATTTAKVIVGLRK